MSKPEYSCGASTMMACVVCARGVRPRDAVSSMCAECARTTLDSETKRADDAEAERDRLRGVIETVLARFEADEEIFGDSLHDMREALEPKAKA